MKQNIKTLIMMSLLVLGFSAAVTGVFNYGAVMASSGSFTLKDGIDSAKPAEAPEDLFGNAGIFQTVVNVLLFLIGAVSVIMIIYGGIRYVTSAGEAKGVESAKNTILYAIVGLIISILAYAIVNFVVGSFGNN